MNKNYIKNLKQKKWANVDIATQVNITPERVRQILVPKVSKKFNAKKYLKKITTSKILLKEIVCLSKVGRQEENVLKKKIMVRYLRNKLKLSLLTIAELLKKDHTTIMYLINN